MTLALLAAGHRVAALARTAETMDELVREATGTSTARNLLPLLADITSDDACERAIAAACDRFGGVDAVINNAGGDVSSHGDRFYTRSTAEWRATLATNLTAPFVLTRLVAPGMVARGWGRIVNTVTSYPTMTRNGFTPYGPTKAALEAATLAWSAELAGTGVTVNAILPGGASDTRRVTRSEQPDRSKLIPPSVMGPPIVWLMSPDSDGCSGMRIVAREWDPAKDRRAENLHAAVQPAFHG